MDCAVRPSPALFADLSLTLSQIVIAAGNDGNQSPEINHYPAKFADPNTKTDFPRYRGNRAELGEVVDNLMVISGTDIRGQRPMSAQWATWITTSAPSEDVLVASDMYGYGVASGTSLGK